MQQFERMTKKLDQGWKLTTMNCVDCKGSYLVNLSTKALYCSKCDKETKQEIDLDTGSKGTPDDPLSPKSNGSSFKKKEASSFGDGDEAKDRFGYQEFFKNNNKSNDASKEIGRLLLQGWAMLEFSCKQCMQPIMQNKQGVKICVQCNKELQKNSTEQSQAKSAQSNLMESLIIAQVTKQEKQLIEPNQNFDKGLKDLIQDKVLSSHSRKLILDQIKNNILEEIINQLNRGSIRGLDSMVQQVNKLDSSSSAEIEQKIQEILSLLVAKHKQLLLEGSYESAHQILDIILMLK